MRILARGLFALVLTILFQSQLFAEYLYKDEIVHREPFTKDIELLGSELYAKTGISLKLVMLKELPDNQDMYKYEQELLATFKEPTVLLMFSEMDAQVDIQVNDNTLYKYFHRDQVLSPVSSAVQAFLIAVVYADSWESFNKLRKDYGGTILPLLAGKAKNEQIVGKYAASMYNGYLDIAHQIATSKEVKLENDPGDANQETLFWVKVFFYGFVLYGIVLYIRKKIELRRLKNEQAE
ncbi:3-dehydroquinate dehydratase [Sulfurimonas marina]|uniref:3-dehydroquinate dehydratase n=1 Tax=Sulfurimonas marina TaxID=2590551 RepID=A0A7M1AXG9_9BACT|nr:3-dehydroquinate dehydratase [Sulfurimonas marina]QOP42124.1 3-dehydroquinate dehydratase [Sulfurimonas marina]